MCIRYANKLVNQFGHLHTKIVLHLFNMNSCSFYGSSVWGLHSNGLIFCIIARYIGVRKMLDLPCTTHTWMLGPLTNYVHTNQQAATLPTHGANFQFANRWVNSLTINLKH